MNFKPRMLQGSGQRHLSLHELLLACHGNRAEVMLLITCTTNIGVKRKNASTMKKNSFQKLIICCWTYYAAIIKLLLCFHVTRVDGYIINLLKKFDFV